MNIAENVRNVRKRMQAAAEGCGRNPDEITLMAVTKTHPVEIVREALRSGVTDIGENRIQEAEKKFGEVSEQAVWHFIGHLQTNKVKYAARFCDVLHSVDSVKLAAEIDKRFGRPVDVYAEVNIGEEEAKTGVSPDETIKLLKELTRFPKLRCLGLMTLPPFGREPEESRKYFRAMREIRDEANRLGIFDGPLTGLSMGMTNDFEIAIEEGATIVRVGTAIFGPRRPRL